MTGGSQLERIESVITMMEWLEGSVAIGSWRDASDDDICARQE